MAEVPKICIIIPYFGSWPEWIDYFFLSCKFNKDVDWLIFTDCNPKEVDTDNIIFINLSLNTFNQLATEKLGIHLCIKHPYKLCDLKPAYGFIFSDYIKNYDFWGYGDLDLVYGNIRDFITLDILKYYDIISNHSDFITGHFCIFRNNPFINELFKEGNFYKTAFQKQNYIGFDEQLSYISINTNFQYLKLFKRINITIHIILVILFKYLKSIIPFKIKIFHASSKKKLKDFTSIVMHFQKRNKIRVLCQKTFQSDLMLRKCGYKSWHIEWNSGYLTNMQEPKELLYFHFLLSKLKKSFFVDTFTNDLKQFVITRIGIFNQ